MNREIKHCCIGMELAVNTVCTKHESRFDCPDAVMHYFDGSGNYGLLIHDGGSSYFKIYFCPWCGKELPISKDETEKQRRSFAYGNVKMHNDDVTREMIDAIADKVQGDNVDGQAKTKETC